MFLVTSAHSLSLTLTSLGHGGQEGERFSLSSPSPIQGRQPFSELSAISRARTAATSRQHTMRAKAQESESENRGLTIQRTGVSPKEVRRQAGGARWQTTAGHSHWGDILPLPGGREIWLGPLPGPQPSLGHGLLICPQESPELFGDITTES